MRSTRHARTLCATTPLDRAACDAIAAWYEHITPRLRHWLALQFPYHTGMLDDFIQDAFVYVCEHAAQAVAMEPDKRVQWVYQIAKNTGRDEARKGGQWRGNSVHLGRFTEPGRLVTIEPSAAAAYWLIPTHADAEPERVQIARESLREALALIPEEHRTTIALLALGYSSIEVAAHLKLTESAVRQRAQRARRIWAERMAA